MKIKPSTVFETLSFKLIQCKSYELHDSWMSHISHSPYLISTLLPSILSEKSDDELDQLRQVSAGGFKDTTRVCNSPVEWGMDIINGNKKELLTLIKQLKSELNSMKNALKVTTYPN